MGWFILSVGGATLRKTIGTQLRTFDIGHVYKNKFDTHVFAFIVYRVSSRPVSLKYCLVLTGMFRFRTAGQYLERCHSAMNSLNMKDVFSNNVCKVSK
jgi:hypothetical protein